MIQFIIPCDPIIREIYYKYYFCYNVNAFWPGDWKRSDLGISAKDE